jgi:hypothetical protein
VSFFLRRVTIASTTEGTDQVLGVTKAAAPDGNGSNGRILGASVDLGVAAAE